MLPIIAVHSGCFLIRKLSENKVAAVLRAKGYLKHIGKYPDYKSDYWPALAQSHTCLFILYFPHTLFNPTLSIYCQSSPLSPYLCSSPLILVSYSLLTNIIYAHLSLSLFSLLCLLSSLSHHFIPAPPPLYSSSYSSSNIFSSLISPSSPTTLLLTHPIFYSSIPLLSFYILLPLH